MKVASATPVRPALALLFNLAVCAALVYPKDGTNHLQAGGGGSCTYDYETHDGSPVVVSASCSISTRDLDEGTEPGTPARQYVRNLGGHDGCTNDDAGHILANRLGGKAEPTNLFPQSPHLNRGAWEVRTMCSTHALDHALNHAFDPRASSTLCAPARPQSYLPSLLPTCGVCALCPAI